MTLTIWTYDWVPAGDNGPRGHVRDLRLRAFAASEAIDAYVERACDRDGFRAAVRDQLAHFKMADETRRAIG